MVSQAPSSIGAHTRPACGSNRAGYAGRRSTAGPNAKPRPVQTAVEAVVVIELIEHLHVLAKNGTNAPRKREHPTRRDLQAAVESICFQRPSQRLGGGADPECRPCAARGRWQWRAHAQRRSLLAEAAGGAKWQSRTLSALCGFLRVSHPAKKGIPRDSRRDRSGRLTGPEY